MTGNTVTKSSSLAIPNSTKANFTSIDDKHNQSTLVNAIIGDSNSLTDVESKYIPNSVSCNQSSYDKIILTIRKAARAEWIAEMKTRETYSAHSWFLALTNLSFAEQQRISDRRDECSREMLQALQQSTLLNRLMDLYNRIPMPSNDPLAAPTFITPVDLPFFQWKGYVRDSSKPIFPTVDICLQNFEKVLRTYSLDLDKNWFRLMPMCLSGEQKMWYNEYIAFSPFDGEPLWRDFMRAFKKRFDVPKKNEHEHATNLLLNITKHTSETIDQFIERFNNLIQRSHPMDPDLLVILFQNALPTILRNELLISLKQIPEARRSDLQTVYTFTRQLDEQKFIDASYLISKSLKRKASAADDSRSALKAKKFKHKRTLKAFSSTRDA